jgi:hypothetical protein
MDVTGPTDAQLITVKELSDLVTQIKRLTQDIMTTGDGEWLTVADQLERVADRLRGEGRTVTELRLLEERNTP